MREKNRESKLKFDIAIKPSRICINVDRTNCSFSLLFLIYAENYGKRKVCRAEHGKDKFISRRRVCSELNKLLLTSKVNKNIFNWALCLGWWRHIHGTKLRNSISISIKWHFKNFKYLSIPENQRKPFFFLINLISFANLFDEITENKL